MGNKFRSKCFEVIDSKWCLRFYPLWGNDNNGYPIVALMLNLISLHTLIYSMSVNFELIFKEGNIAKTQNQQFYRTILGMATNKYLFKTYGRIYI